jgi:hypothetical protein
MVERVRGKKESQEIMRLIGAKYGSTPLPSPVLQ